MRKRKRIDLLGVPNSKRIRLVWKARRQIQQEVLEEKLKHLLFGGRANLRYPEAMNPLIEDFMRKADDELKRKKIFF